MKYKKGDFVMSSRGTVVEIIETNTSETGDMYLVRRFDEVGHDGNGHSKEEQRSNEFWYMGESDMVEIVESTKIEIVSFLGESYGRYYENGNLTFQSHGSTKELGCDSFYVESSKRSKAHLNTDKNCWYAEIISNEYFPRHDFLIGDVVKVIDRGKNFATCINESNRTVMTVNIKDLKKITMVRRDATEGEYIYITDPVYSFNKTGDVMKVSENVNGIAKVFVKDHINHSDIPYSMETWWVYEKSDYLVVKGYVDFNKFRPHLKYGNEIIGYIGEPTDICDITGKELCVGDVVQLIEYDGTPVKLGCRYICKESESYVMGLKSADIRNGKYHGFFIVKEKGYSSLHDGEKYGTVEAILREK